MDYAHPYPDIEVAGIVEALLGRFRALDPTDMESMAAAGDPLEGETRDPAALLELAGKMCDEGEFRHALPIAFHLVMQRKPNARAAFLTGTCLQRMGHPEFAVGFFGVAMMLADGSTAPAAMFRSGECLAAMGKTQEALDSFDGAVELARAEAGMAGLQAMAQAKADGLRASR